MLSLSDVRRAGNSVGRAFLLFSLLSPAMFGASCAFLPSSFSMALNALAMALWLREKWFLSTFLTASNKIWFDGVSRISEVLHMVQTSLAGEGHVYEGMLRGGQNAVATVRVDDADFVKLIGGQLDATRCACARKMGSAGEVLHMVQTSLVEDSLAR
uniref:Mannosyltransferase n=1 Tax=Globodera pallida TaxID=36090 RepID=A0A183BUS2_GLOPA